MSRGIVELQESFSNATENPALALRAGLEWLPKVIANQEAVVNGLRPSLKLAEEKLQCYQQYRNKYEEYKSNYDKSCNKGDNDEAKYLREYGWKNVKDEFRIKGLIENGHWLILNPDYLSVNNLKSVYDYIDALQKSYVEQHSKLKSHEFELEQLRDASKIVAPIRYPANKSWKFGEVNQEISRLYRQLTGVHSTIRNGLNELASQLKTKTANDADITRRVVNLEAALLNACSLTVALTPLYEVRRQLLPLFLSEVKTWGTGGISVELQKFTRDLNELIPDDALIPDADAQSLIKLPQRELALHLPLYAVFGEQRRFLQDVTFELEAALKWGNTDRKPAPNPVNERKNIIKELAELDREMKEMIHEHPHMEKEIRKTFGKRTDKLKEEL